MDMEMFMNLYREDLEKINSYVENELIVSMTDYGMQMNQMGLNSSNKRD